MSLVETWSPNGGGDPGANDDLLRPITKSAPSLEEPRPLVRREGEEASKREDADEEEEGESKEERREGREEVDEERGIPDRIRSRADLMPLTQ